MFQFGLALAKSRKIRRFLPESTRSRQLKTQKPGVIPWIHPERGGGAGLHEGRGGRSADVANRRDEVRRMLRVSSDQA